MGELLRNARFGLRLAKTVRGHRIALVSSLRDLMKSSRGNPKTLEFFIDSA